MRPTVKTSALTLTLALQLASNAAQAGAGGSGGTVFTTSTPSVSLDLVFGTVTTAGPTLDFVGLSSIGSTGLLDDLIGKNIDGFTNAGLPILRDANGDINTGTGTEFAFGPGLSFSIVQKPSTVTNVHDQTQLAADFLGSGVFSSYLETSLTTLQFNVDLGTTTTAIPFPGGFEVIVNDTIESDTVSVFDVTAATDSLPAAVPEPSALLLLGSALSGLLIVRARRKRA